VGGQLVQTLFQGQAGAGIHSVRWNGRDQQGRQVANGVYFYKLEAGPTRLTNKLVLLR
jgi:flagellar hook assembly protein FlgD